MRAGRIVRIGPNFIRPDRTRARAGHTLNRACFGRTFEVKFQPEKASALSYANISNVCKSIRTAQNFRIGPDLEYTLWAGPLAGRALKKRRHAHH